MHLHVDPITGQRYAMPNELHMRIPSILASRMTPTNTMVGSTVTAGSTTMGTQTGNEYMDLFLNRVSEVPSLSPVNQTLQISNVEEISPFVQPVESVQQNSFVSSTTIGPNQNLVSNIDRRLQFEMADDQTIQVINTQPTIQPVSTMDQMNQFNEMGQISQVTPVNVVNQPIIQTTMTNQVQTQDQIRANQIKPINRFNNIIDSSISAGVSINRYTPTNNFNRISVGSLQSFEFNRYVPINRFINQ
jgi:hypothetical protein